MLSVIFCSIGILLAIIGFVDIIRMVVFVFLKTNNDGCVLVVPIQGHNEEAELLLRSAAAKVQWISWTNKQQAICLDLGMDEETLNICKMITEEYEFMKILTKEEFDETYSEYIKQVES